MIASIRRAAILALLAGFASLPAALAPATSDPRFDWFSYTGEDSVYRVMPAGADDYVNPILAGFYPDPSITRVGDDYYLVTSSFAYFPGVPIFRSRDLTHWRQIGHVLDRPSQLDLDNAGVSRGIFAPSIRYRAGRYYMLTTLVDRGGTFFVSATNPAGPWSDPVWLPSVDGIDPSFFFDDDGKAYVVNNGPPIGRPRYEGHRAIWIQEFDPASQRMVGRRTRIVDAGVNPATKPIWIEAPHIFRKDGRYYLICAEGGSAYQHSEVVFRSDSVTGPYRPYAGNPILTQRHLDRTRPFPITTAGHADFVETPAGEWWAAFLAVRPYEGDRYNTGRETFLMPVRWVNGWPVITTGEERVPYVRRRPGLPAQSASAADALAGNFTVRDDFDDATLGLTWEMLRTPRERWYDLTSSPGSLTLRARPVRFTAGQPSFLARRQQHLRASASTLMRYRPERDGDAAGLVAFQNETHYFFLAVTRVKGETRVQLEQHAGRASGISGRVLASAPIHLAGEAPVYLRVDARGRSYDFFFGTAPDAWMLLAQDVDGSILSTQVAGGFVGTMLGLYAYRAP
jgi:alpha-N-arabinofuranosidase